jgi:hypothetical protein
VEARFRAQQRYVPNPEVFVNAPNEHTPDPSRIVDVLDYSEATLRSVLAHVQASSTFSHFVYREAEMDTLLRLTTTDLENAQTRGAQEEARVLERLLSAVIDAHNFVGEHNAGDAAQRLSDAVQLVTSNSTQRSL